MTHETMYRQIRYLLVPPYRARLRARVHFSSRIPVLTTVCPLSGGRRCVQKHVPLRCVLLHPLQVRNMYRDAVSSCAPHIPHWELLLGGSWSYIGQPNPFTISSLRAPALNTRKGTGKPHITDRHMLPHAKPTRTKRIVQNQV